MNIQELLQGVDCACGRHYSCNTRFVAIEKDAIALHLAEQAAAYQHILLVADENTYGAAGEKTVAALGEKLSGKVIFSGKTVLIPNEDAVDAVNAALSGIDLIVGIGSGVIQDLCKYVAHTNGLPYFVIATAPSMDGYTSDGAAMIMGGMKVTYAAKIPEVILADTQVLKNAPMEMIQAGYGDIVGKYSALNDWRLSHVVNDEYLCPFIYDLTFQMVQKVLSLAAGLVRRDEESVQVLMEALIVVGIAMSFAGSSRPASGSEHHLSHYFEITGIVRGEEYFPHGIDVAYSTVITAALREEILKRPWPDHAFRASREAYTAQIQRIYGSVAEGCIALQDKVGRYKMDPVPAYHAKEAQIRQILSEMPTASQIEAMLQAVGMDMAQFYALYDDQKIADAKLYAKELKDRYTVLWLYYDLFGG